MESRGRFFQIVEYLRVSFSGRTAASQAAGKSSILFTRTNKVSNELSFKTYVLRSKENRTRRGSGKHLFPRGGRFGKPTVFPRVR